MNQDPSTTHAKGAKHSQQNSPTNQTKRSRFKCITLGEPGVGKTSLVQKLSNGTFNPNLRPTCSPDCVEKNILVSAGSRITLDIWDTAGQERFRSLSYSYFRDTQAVLLLYDPGSKLRLGELVKDVRYHLGEGRKERTQINALLFLVATKIDEGKDHVFTEGEVQHFSLSYDVAIHGAFGVSSKTGENVDACIRTVAELLWHHEQEKQDQRREKEAIRLAAQTPANSDGKRRGGCRCYSVNKS